MTQNINNQNTNRINLETESHIVEELTSFCENSGGLRNTYAIVVRNSEGNLEIHPRRSRPCYGEMRNYKEKSKNRPGDRFPGDLLNNFPDGTPCAVAFPFSKSNPKNQSDMIEKLFSDYNPWLGKNSEFVNNIIFLKNKKNRNVGVIVNTGDISPTYLVATFMKTRSIGSNQCKVYDDLKELGVEDKSAYLLSLISYNYNGIMLLQGPIISQQTNVFKYLNQEPIDLDDGLLWSDRCDYNRPYIMYAFCDGFIKDNPTKVVKPMHILKYDSYENLLRKFNLLPETEQLLAA